MAFAYAKALKASRPQSLKLTQMGLLAGHTYSYSYCVFIIFSCILEAVTQSVDGLERGLRLHCQRLFVQLLINIYLQVQRMQKRGKSNCHDKYDKPTDKQTNEQTNKRKKQRANRQTQQTNKCIAKTTKNGSDIANNHRLCEYSVKD